MIIVTNLQGVSEPIIDIQQGAAIRQRISENYELSFTAIKTANNQYAYDLLQNDAMVTIDSENFIIKNVNEMPFSKNILALHEFFDILDDFVEAKLADGDYTIQQALEHAFSQATGWSWVVDDTFEAEFLTEFGADNPLSLLTQIMEIYGAEYTMTSIGKLITIKKKIGVQTDEQVRFKHNLSSINRDIDSSNVKTAVNVHYALDDYGTYTQSVVYISPNSNNYRRLKWAEPLYLDHVFTEAEALEVAQAQLNDVPNISIATTFVELKNSGYNADNIALGNSFYLIDERMNLNESVRIVEIEKYPLDEGKSPSLVCANSRKIIENVNVNQQRQQNTLNREAVKQAAIYNGASITETEGILINGRNGVRIRLNADIGFLIEKNNQREFYVDTNGNLTFDGRLNITENGQTLLEAYQDDKGGLLQLNDISGGLNVRLGAADLLQNLGGSMELLNNGVNTVQINANNGIGGSRIVLRDNSGTSRIILDTTADNPNGPLVQIGNIIITNGLIRINNEIVATQQWVRDNFEPKTP